MSTVEHLLLGPPTHGVTHHGRSVAGAHRVSLRHVGPGARDLAATLRSGQGDVHVHVTDHLLGDDADVIALAVGELATTARPVHLTLHDIPQPAEGEPRFARRRETYRRLVDLAASIQVCSEHERDLLEEMTSRPVDAVVRLPVDVSQLAPSRVTRRMQVGPVGALGFVHPGKNPGAALTAAARIGRGLRLLGALGPGHEALFEELQMQAMQAGVACTVTGHLTEKRMDEQIAGVSVPVAPYRHISASGSIGRWIAAGRRPVVLRNPWVEELARHAPWALTVVDPPEFCDAVAAASENLASTLTGGRRDGLLTTEQAARTQAEVLEVVSRA